MIKKLALNSNEKTVFSFTEIAQISERAPDQKLVSAVSYYVRKGDLIRISKGLYALNNNYDLWELGNKLRTPSYISLYSILQKEGVVFQPYDSIFLVAARSQKLKINGHTFVYRKIKDEILLNSLGIEIKKNICVASLERALLDKIYLDGDEYFDNISSIDWYKAKILNEKVYKRIKIEKYVNSMINA